MMLLGVVVQMHFANGISDASAPNTVPVPNNAQTNTTNINCNVTINNYH